MKPGDEVMLVTTRGYGSKRLYIRRDRVKAVHKNGQVVLEQSGQRYRADGKPTGKGSSWRDSRPNLHAWDDALWQRFQIEQSQDAMASSLFKLSEHFQRVSRDPEKAAEVWESLPFAVRQMVEKDEPL